MWVVNTYTFVANLNREHSIIDHHWSTVGVNESEKGFQLLITENNLNCVTATKVFIWSLRSQGLLANYRTVQTAPWYTHKPTPFSVSFLVVSEIDSCKEEAAGGYSFFAIWLALFLPLSCSVCIPHSSTLLLRQFCLRSMRRLRAAHLVLMNQDFMLPGGKQAFHYDFLKPCEVHISQNIEKLDIDLKLNLKTHKTELGWIKCTNNRQISKCTFI